jgi:hypothetical protein
MLKVEIKKKPNKLTNIKPNMKKIEKKNYELVSTRFNLLNPRPESWGRDKFIENK